MSIFITLINGQREEVHSLSDRKEGANLMYKLGDEVEIIDAMDTSWKGKKGVITVVSNYKNSLLSYRLDIGGGDWLHSMLKKI